MIKKFIFKASLVLLIIICVMWSTNIDDKEEININDFKEVNNFIQMPDKRLKLSEIRQINEDVVAWINIPGTDIDWPVMKWVSTDVDEKSFYDRKDEYKRPAFEGSIYSGKGVKFEPFSDISNNLVLHGHNLDDNPNGKRFAQLIKFQNIEFAKNTPYIFVTTQDAQLVYQIYAIYFTDLNFNCYWIGLDHDSQEEMIKGAKERSEYIYDVNVMGDDKIITLSTCTYRYGKYKSIAQENTRFVVQGKLLDKNDNLLPTVSITKNFNPKQPIWFK